MKRSAIWQDETGIGKTASGLELFSHSSSRPKDEKTVMDILSHKDRRELPEVELGESPTKGLEL